MKTIEGKYLTINEYNIFFSDISKMLLEHFDNKYMKDTVIVLGSYIKFSAPELKKMYPGKKLIIYQLEQLIKIPGDTWHNTDQTIKNLIGADEIWDYDQLNIKFLEIYHNICVDRYVPMRYTKSLDRGMSYNNKEDIDLLFYGQLFGRRLRIVQKLEQRIYGKINFVTLFGIHGEQLDEYIRRSKIVLNLHAFEPYHRQEQSRIFYLLNNGRCILSEKSQLNNFKDIIVECDENTIVSKLEYLLSNNKYIEYGERGKEKFKNLKYELMEE